MSMTNTPIEFYAAVMLLPLTVYSLNLIIVGNG